MRLFEPIAIRGMALKDRIALPPMVVMPFTYDYRSRELGGYFVERTGAGPARSRLATPTPTRSSATRPGAKQGELPVSSLNHVPSLTQYDRQERRLGYDFPITISLSGDAPEQERALTSGLRPRPRVRKARHFAPADCLSRVNPPSRKLSPSIGNFATAAPRAKSAGFDSVEFHNSHRRLPCQVLSPADNHHTDKYGGNLSGRMRFALECMQAVWAKVGDDYAVFVRLADEEERPGGITLADSMALAAELAKAGAGVIDVSGGLTTHPRGYVDYLSPTKRFPMGTLVPLAEAIKQKVGGPIVAVGRINRPEVAESILTNRKADFAAIGRQLIADPFWPEKVAEGRLDEIVERNHCWRGLRGVTHFHCRLDEHAWRERAVSS